MKKVNCLRRLIALYIDFIIIIILASLITNLITLGNFNLSTSASLKYLSIIIYLILFFTLMLLKDLTFKNSSIGKKTLKIGVFYKNGNMPNSKVLIKRTATSIFIFPIEILLLIFNNQTISDKKYNTKVDYITSNR